MKISDLFTMAMGNLWRRKVRTGLTILGVVIGCASIIVMVSFGIAQQKQMEQITGSTSALQNINVYPTTYYDPAMGGKAPSKGIITDELIKKIEAMPNVDSVIYHKKLDPYHRGSSIKFGKYKYFGEIAGMDQAMMEAADITVTEGRIFNPKAKDIEVLASGMAKYMLDSGKMSMGGMGDMAEIEKINLMEERAVLTLGQDGGSMGGIPMDGMDDMDQGSGTSVGKKNYRIKVVGMTGDDFFGMTPGIIMPLEKVEELNAELDKMAGEKNKKKLSIYENIKVKVKDTNLIDDTANQIKDLGVEAQHDTEFIEELNRSTQTMQAILGGIGGISLLVAAIGITNTMVMSIYERTKEIGVMKVIGAKVSDIRNLFLLEAGMIGFFGGVAGVALAYGISKGLNTIVGSMMENSGMMSGETTLSIIPPGLALVALGACFIIGIITGYYPAVRATKLSAIEAIRTE